MASKNLILERRCALGRLVQNGGTIRRPGADSELHETLERDHKGAVHARVAPHRQEGVSAVRAREIARIQRLPSWQEVFSHVAAQHLQPILQQDFAIKSKPAERAILQSPTQSACLGHQLFSVDTRFVLIVQLVKRLVVELLLLVRQLVSTQSCIARESKQRFGL